MNKKLNRTTTATPPLPVRVLQFGEGNFLRAFADWMIDVMNEKSGFDAAVQVVQPIRNGMGEAINEQEGLYHVVLNGIHNGKSVRNIRLITCIRGVINPFTNIDDYLKAAENPDLQFIISNTTEAGIVFNPADTDPHTLPESFPGKLTMLLHHRFTFFKGDPKKSLTLFPCELIEKNGEALRKTVLQYAERWKLPEDFKQWISQHTTFCNTLVDRIVPGYPKEEIKDIQKEIGYEDNLVVTAEAFHLWVIEPCTSSQAVFEAVQRSFPAEAAGLQVKFVNDLTPYRTRKVRILNGAHTAMVPVAYLRGLRTVREAVEDPFCGDFIRNMLNDEIIPGLDLPAKELQQYAADVIERFQNPYIRHELQSIALNSISKFQVRVLPSILQYRERTGTLPQRLLHALAALICFYKGEWRGEIIPLNDTPSVLDFFKKAWSSNDPGSVTDVVLSNKELWGIDLSAIEGMCTVVTNHLTTIIIEEKTQVSS